MPSWKSANRISPSSRAFLDELNASGTRYTCRSRLRMLHKLVPTGFFMFDPCSRTAVRAIYSTRKS